MCVPDKVYRDAVVVCIRFVGCLVHLRVGCENVGGFGWVALEVILSAAAAEVVVIVVVIV